MPAKRRGFCSPFCGWPCAAVRRRRRRSHRRSHRRTRHCRCLSRQQRCHPAVTYRPLIQCFRYVECKTITEWKDVDTGLQQCRSAAAVANATTLCTPSCNATLHVLSGANQACLDRFVQVGTTAVCSQRAMQ